jgi:hypothetical protein
MIPCAENGGRSTFGYLEEAARIERDISHKLAVEVDQPIVTERQVVYTLVELRKLLEKRAVLY